MTMQECYWQLGGDLTQAEKRLSSGDLVRRFLAKFLDDGSFSALCTAMEEGDRDKAFRASHTLKGVSGSLSLNRLSSSVSQLSDLLRPVAGSIPAGAAPVFEKVKQDYTLTASTIRAYLDSGQR